MKPIAALAPGRSRAEAVEKLRRLLPCLETGRTQPRTLSFGLPVLDEHLPLGGLMLGALHEIAPLAGNDRTAALGFLVALLARLPDAPLLFVMPRALAAQTRPHGHGLNRMGLDPARVLLIETAGEKQSLWALEEALRSAVPAAVAGAIGRKLDLRASQRLHLAAGESGVPLFLLRPAGAFEPGVAVTRWEIGSVPAARDRFGMIVRSRWRVVLSRCRNGRTNEWLVEYDHAARCFSLSPPLAGAALSRGAGARGIRRAG